MGRLPLHRKRNKDNKKKGSNSSRKTSNQQAPNDAATGGSWVERLVWVPVEHDDYEDEEESSIPHPGSSRNEDDKGAASPTLSIISWNILAEAYCSRRSHRELPKVFQKRVFDPQHRRETLVRIVTRLIRDNHPDVLCLQEWDLPQVLGPVLQRHGYANAVETPRVMGGGSGGRTDACVVFVRTTTTAEAAYLYHSDEDAATATNKNTKREGWEVVDHQIVRFDDLATLSSTPKTVRSEESGLLSRGADEETTTATTADVVEPEAFSGNNLQGFQRSFLRRNMGLIVRLQHVPTQRTVIVANAHLYWNPGFEYVKLVQAHYILKRMKAFQNHKQEPILLCGDLNSRPHGVAHTYLSHGVINAKVVAPWYATQTNGSEETMVEEEQEEDDEAGTTGSPEMETTGKERVPASLHSVTDGIGNLILEPNEDNPSQAFRVNDSTTHTSDDKSPQMRYMLDASLNKLCRWLRILGQDVALETDAEEQLRTGRGEPVIFDRCRDERRTLVTTSPRLMQRRDCPASVYCISPPFSVQKLECSLMHMLLTHGVVLEPSKFLGRCVVCNGNIIEVHCDDEKRRILTGHKAPAELINDGLDVYECNGCQQGYWWNENPMSSASRVKNSASHLFELCLRAGVPFRGPHEDLFDHLDVQGLRQEGWDYTTPGSELLQERLDVVDWLKDEHLEAPFALESAYCRKSRDADGKEILVGESIPFSNVTFGFVSVLDYIFFEKMSCLTLVDRLYIPTSLPELTDGRTKLRNSHLLPSDVWPSDHLAIGARFTLMDQQSATEKAFSNKPKRAEKTPSTTASPNAGRKTSSVASTHDSLQFCVPTATSKDNSSTASLPYPVSTGPTAAATPHGVRCACGCVPAIPSLFEMAAMRKRFQQAKASMNGDSSAIS